MSRISGRSKRGCLPCVCHALRGPLHTLALALLVVGLAAPAHAQPRSPIGDWQGTLAGLRLVVHLAADSSGALRGTLDSPDQGAVGIPIDRATLAGDTLTLGLTPLGASYTGVFDASGDSLTGVWHQGGAALPFSLRRGTGAVALPKRPQTPRPPYPYDTLDVRVPGGADGVTLAGTLTVPRAPGRHPAVLLLTGSGPQDRDETLFEHRPFKVIADHLTRRGFVVLRADDRGAGRSTGRFAGATTEDFALDALALAEWLMQRPEVDSARVGLIGHSEGGLIAPMVAARDRRVAFIVLMAGPGVRGDSLMLRQGDDMRRAMGMPDAERALQRQLSEQVLGVLRTESDTTRALRRVRAATRAMLGETAGAFPPEALDAVTDEQVRRLASPWFRWFINHDPRPPLRLVRCPVLALNGERDTQVAADANLTAIAAALREGGNPDVTTRALPWLNHLFQEAVTGGMDEYGRLEQTFAPAALDALGAWLEAKAKGGR